MSYYVQLPNDTYVEVPDNVSREDAYKQITAAYPDFAPQEKQSAFRQVADVPLQIAKGAVSASGMIANAFGAGSETAQTIKGVEGYLDGLLSAQSKKDSAEIARIMNDAKDKGVYDQVVAGLKAFSVAPIDMLSNAVGTAAPVIASSAASLLGAGPVGVGALGAAIGATMGAGSIKGSIYDEVKQVLTEKGVSPAVAEERAQQAQSYNGENLDQILLGAGLGSADALTGASRVLRNVAMKAAGAATTGAEKEVGRGILRRTATGAAAEAPLEALQGGQEQLAQNIAVQREGVERPTWQGVAGQAALEGIAGAGLGGVTGAAFGKRPEPIIPPVVPPTAPASPTTVPGGGVPPAPLPAPGLPSTGGPLATPGSVAQTLAQPPATVAANPAAAQQVAQAAQAQQLAAQTGAVASTPQPGPTQIAVPTLNLPVTSATPIAPTPAQAAPTVEPIAPTTLSLPQGLVGAKPKFNQTPLTFENDIDKALYIVQGTTKSKAHEEYRKWLLGQGFTPSSITLEGNKVRNKIKSLLQKAPGVDTFNVPSLRPLNLIFTGQAPAVQPPSPAPVVSTAPAVEPPTTAPVTTAAPPVEPPVAPQFNLAPPAPIASSPPVSPIQTPPEHQVKTLTTDAPAVPKIDVAPKVVELSSIISSEVPGYDPILQPRNRDKVGSEVQIQDIISKFDPSKLIFDPSTKRGAPIVDENGHVESGNGRTMALRRIYETRPDLAEAYRQELARNGFNTTGMKNPVLVQQRTTQMTPEQRQAYIGEANVPDVLLMSPAEQAKEDAKYITNAMLDKIPPGRDFTYPGFVVEFMKHIPSTEQGQMRSADGSINSLGVLRIRNAIFAKAYGDTEALSRIAESTDDNIKSISNALLDNAGVYAKLRSSIEANKTDPGFSADPLIDAVNRISQMRDKGLKLENYLSQVDAFNPVPPMTERFMRLFYSEKARALGRDKISDGLNYYATEALKIDPEPALGFGLPPVTPMDLIDAAIKRTQGTVEGQATLALAPPPKPLVTENIQPPTVETAPPLAAITVTEKKRIKLNDVDGYATRVTFSDGTVSEIQRMDSSTTMGLPGWHDLSKSLMEFSYLGDTEAQAIQELLQRRNAEKFAPVTTTPMDNTVLDSVKKTTKLEVGQDTRDFLNKHLPGVVNVIQEAQYRLYPGTTFKIDVIQGPTKVTSYGRAGSSSQRADITIFADNLMKDFGGKSFPEKLLHTLMHEFAHPIEYSWIHTASMDTQLAVVEQFKKERSSTAVQRAALMKYLVDSQQPGFDITGYKNRLLKVFDLTEEQYSKLLSTTYNIGEKSDLYRYGVSRQYLRNYSEWVAEKGAQWLSKELQGRLPSTVFEKFQKTILDKLRDAYQVLGKLMGVKTSDGAFEKLLSDIWGVKTKTPFSTIPAVKIEEGLPANQQKAYQQIVENNDTSGVEQLPGGPTAKLNSERWAKVSSSVREFFDPWYTVDKYPILSEFRNLLFGKIGMATQKAKDLSGIISKGTQEVQTQTYTYLTTRNADPSMITDEAVRKAAVEVKKEINRTAQEMVDKGMLTEDSLAKYYDQYLPRMYLYYEMTGRGIKTQNMGISPREYLKLRNEDFSPEERQIMGEIKNPAFLSYVALSRPQKDMAMADYFENIKNQSNVRWIAENSLVDFNGHKVTPYWLAAEAKTMRELAALTERTDPAGSQAMQARAAEMQTLADQAFGSKSDTIPDNYKRLPDSHRYGALRGAIIQKGIYDDIVGTFIAIPVSEKPFMQALLGDERSTIVKANQLWKMMKVTLNIPSQIRNMVSNAIALNVFGGVPLHRIAPLLLRASREVSENGKYWQEAQKYGITGGTMSSAELIQMRATLEQYLRKGGGKDMMGAFAAMRIAAGNAVGAASDIYQKTEVLFKMVQFIHEREKGSTPSQAVDAANDALFDYTKVNPNIRFLRNSPVGLPFVTYYYKVLPKLVETAYKHPTRFAPYVALALSIPYLTMSVLDIDSDDYESLRKSLPEYIRNKGSLFIMPWKDEKGRWQYFDLAPFFPWAAFTDPIIQATLRQDPKGAAGEAAKLITPSGPIVTVLAAIATGRDPFTDKEILDPRQTPENKALALMSYVWNQTLPSMLAIDLVNPQNASGAIPRLYNDAFGDGTGLDKRGQPRPEFLADAARLFGANISPLDPVTQRALNINHMLAQIRASESLRAQVAKDQSLTPNKRMQEINSLNGKIRDDYKKLQEYAQETARATSLKK